MLGQEVKYDSSTMDNELLQIAKDGNMVLLTRDRELYHRALARQVVSALVLGETEEERLAQIAETFGVSLDVAMDKTKCPECGSDLRETSKNNIADKVPQASVRLYDRFWECTDPACGKVYWVGSHWKQIRQTLEEARNLTGLER
jgi:uncharacterized protein with PIN domain